MHIHIYIYIYTACARSQCARPASGATQDKSRLTGVPNKSLCQRNEIRSDSISADPIRPFPSLISLHSYSLILVISLLRY